MEKEIILSTPCKIRANCLHKMTVLNMESETLDI